MDSSHVAIAASGLLSGLWFGASHQEPDHSVAASERGHSEGLWFRLAGIGVLNWFCWRKTLPWHFGSRFVGTRLDFREFTLSVKGNSGKGVYGAPKGLRITDT